MSTFIKFKIPWFFILLIYPIISMADSPWFGEEGDKSMSITIVTESYDEFWKGENKIPGPPNNVENKGIDQKTLWLRYESHVADDISYSITTGVTTSSFEPASRGDLNGLADSSVAFKYLLLDEFSGTVYPTVSIRAGIIIAGSYEKSSAGNPHSPGDGAHGGEASILVGKLLSNNISLLSELGYRYKNNDVPSDLFYSAGLRYQFTNGWSLNGLYAVTNGLSGTDIGGTGFSPSEFEKLEEDRSLFDIGLFLPIGASLGAGINYAKVINGKNTGKSDIINLTFSYSFSTY